MNAKQFANLTLVFRENLEGDIIAALSDQTGLPIRKAMDVYYRSKLSEQISDGAFGIDNLDPKNLADDLIENETDLIRAV